MSFDLWLTLIKSNPLFKRKRAELIADKYNPNGFSISSVFNIIQDIDRKSDRYNEMTGKKLATEFMYSSIVKKLGFKEDCLNHDLLIEIKQNINELFFQNQPFIFNDNIIKMLGLLVEEGYSLNISSNTGFIEGLYLMKLFKLIEIDHFFNFAVFSDEIHASKPSSVFFENVFQRIEGKKNEVIHVGDNYIADYNGARDFGFRAILIVTKDYSIDFIRSKIHEENKLF